MGEAAKPLGFPLSEVSVRPVRDAAERAGGLPPAQRATAKAGDMDPMDAAKKMSDQIWKESWTHGPRGGRQHRAHRNLAQKSILFTKDWMNTHPSTESTM